MRHFLTLNDFTRDEIMDIIELSDKIKKEYKSKTINEALKNKTLGMIFEKSSTRTRVSFEAGIYQLGGVGLFLSSNDIQLGRGEPIKDTARVISSMVDMIMLRTDAHKKLEEFASFSSVPVINGLSDDFHPIQLMADIMTIKEHKKCDLKNMKVAYVGDGNNMANSWMIMASKLGFHLSIATPKGYETKNSILELANKNIKDSGAKIEFFNSAKEAVDGVDVIVTDTWTSMGDEEQKKQRQIDFKDFTVDDNILNLAKNDVSFLHCLPAYRGLEVTNEVIEGDKSLVFYEAENRLHVQKGIMVWLDEHKEQGIK
jgi:ornithine carbamoyltransferase